MNLQEKRYCNNCFDELNDEEKGISNQIGMEFCENCMVEMLANPHCFVF